MKSTLLLATALLTTSLGALAANPLNLTVDSTHTYPSFEVKHNGLTLQRGRFNETAGSISFDKGAQAGTIDITIKSASIDTGNEALETHLKGPDFFDVAKYPTLTFKGKLAKFVKGAPTTAVGTLTLKGVSKPVTLQINHFAEGANPFTKKTTFGVDASTTIKRSDFGITYGIPVVANDVKLLINVEAVAP